MNGPAGGMPLAGDAASRVCEWQSFWHALGRGVQDGERHMRTVGTKVQRLQQMLSWQVQHSCSFTAVSNTHVYVHGSHAPCRHALPEPFQRSAKCMKQRPTALHPAGRLLPGSAQPRRPSRRGRRLAMWRVRHALSQVSAPA